MYRVKKVLFYIKAQWLNLLGADIDSSAEVHRLNLTNSKNLRIGKKSVLYWDLNLLIGECGKLVIGKRSHIAPFGYLLIENQKLEIGNYVAIGPFCSFICRSNSTENFGSKLFVDSYTAGDIKVGSNVFIGAQCVILAGTEIEDNVVVAANSVVKGRLEAGFIYGGSPAEKIRPL